VAVDGIDETIEVHGPEVDNAVSAYSRVPEVRDALMDRQRSLVEGGRIIMAGRDIGTVVLPDADLKLYLDASVEERARRRAEERGEALDSPAGQETLIELRRRDRLDSERPVAPLRAAEDAVVIRTDGNAFETTVGLVVDAIRAREREEAGASDRPEPGSSREQQRTDSTTTPAPRRPRRPPPKPTPIDSRMTLARRFGSAVLRTLARSILRITVEGDPEAVPRTGPVIVVGNHTSSADPVLIGAFLNGRIGRAVNWIGKRELVEMPVIGPFMRMVPIHPVDRDAADLEAFRTATRILEAGNVLAIFPEGTRSLDGKLQPVREGAAVLALRSGAPVMPVAIVDSDLAWPKSRVAPRFGRHVTVRWGTPFRVADEIPGIESMSRREANAAATRLIMTRIAELLPPRQRGVYADDVAAAQDAADRPAVAAGS
jgi:1-acyl-sn-glycerol-3-phosphate acyltransferase